MTVTMTAPSRPTAAEVASEVAQHVRTLAGPDAEPRPEQLAAVHAMMVDARRTLLVARTGLVSRRCTAPLPESSQIGGGAQPSWCLRS